MIRNDFDNKPVIVTGGTKGLGLAIGLAFAGEGAQVYLTNKSDSVDETEVQRLFADRGPREPRIVQADASRDDDTDRLLELVAQDYDRIFVLVSNVSVAPVGGNIDEMSKAALFESLGFGAWPLVSHVQKIKKRFGCYPRYTLATSFDGPDAYYPGHETVAATTVVMETFAKYMAKHMYEEERVNINVIRSRPVPSESLAATLGDGFESFVRKYYGDDYLVEAEAIGEAALAVCSGLMDAMTGQVMLLDKGVSFQDSTMRLYEHRAEHDLPEG